MKFHKDLNCVKNFIQNVTTMTTNFKRIPRVTSGDTFSDVEQEFAGNHMKTCKIKVVLKTCPYSKAAVTRSIDFVRISPMNSLKESWRCSTATFSRILGPLHTPINTGNYPQHEILISSEKNTNSWEILTILETGITNCYEVDVVSKSQEILLEIPMTKAWKRSLNTNEKFVYILLNINRGVDVFSQGRTITGQGHLTSYAMPLSVTSIYAPQTIFLCP